MNGVDINMATSISELAFLANPVSSHIQSQISRAVQLQSVRRSSKRCELRPSQSPKPSLSYLGDAAKLLYQGFDMSLRSPSICNLRTSGTSDCGTQRKSVGSQISLTIKPFGMGSSPPLMELKDCFNQK